MMADSSFLHRTDAFLLWFRSLPGATFSDAIKIVDLRSQNAGRGIVATSDIEAETTLFTIPRQGIISVHTSELAKKLPDLFNLENDAVAEDDQVEALKLDSWSSLILIMMYEFLKGDQSAWKPYFDVLPESFDTPMFWSEEELAELQASSVQGKIGKEDAENIFRTSLIPIIRQNAELFAGTSDINDDALVALAHRMGSTIMSYAFDLENEDEEREEDEEEGWVEDRDGKSLMGMVPMADILNADAEFNVHVNHGEDSLTVTALRPIAAGEEILNYYGPHPNSELLRRYGYVTPKHARYDVVEIPWDVVKTAVQSELGIPQTILQQVDENIDSEELEDTFVLERESGEPNADGTFPGPAAITEIPGDLLEQLKGFLKIVKKIDPASIPDKRKRDDTIQAVVAKAIQVLESRYPTSRIEDEKLLQDSSLSRRQRMAVEVRRGEKKILQEAREFLQGDPMDEDEDQASKRTKTSA